MEAFTLFMFVAMVISVSMAVWLNTKSGQKWIDSL